MSSTFLMPPLSPAGFLSHFAPTPEQLSDWEHQLDRHTHQSQLHLWLSSILFPDGQDKRKFTRQTYVSASALSHKGRH
jgi:hypothetical protein